MTSASPIKKTTLCAVAGVLCVLLVQEAFAGLPARWGTRQPSTWGGSWSPSGFDCETLAGQGTTNVRVDDGVVTVEFDGEVMCTNFGDGGPDDVVEGPKACRIHVEHTNVEAGACLRPGDSGFPSEAAGFQSFQPYSQQCSTISKSSDISGFVDCGTGSDGQPAFATCEAGGGETGVDCGVLFGITTDQAVCGQIFGSGADDDATLLNVGIAYESDANCGLPEPPVVEALATLADEASLQPAKIDFEESCTDTGPVSSLIDIDGVTTGFSCEGAGNDESCYYVQYGPGRSGFVGADGSGGAGQCGRDDNPEDVDPATCLSPAAGRCGLTDEINGPDDADDLQMVFSEPVKDVSIDVIDYRKDGGPGIGDRVTLTVYGEGVGGIPVALGSSSYEVTGGEPDGNIENLAVSADNVVSASVTASKGDIGVGYDNIRYEQPATTQVTTATSRACASNDKTDSFNGGFVTDPSFDPVLNCAADTSETRGEVTPEVQLPEDNILCKGKFTRNMCGRNKPTIVIYGSAILDGRDIARRSVEIDGFSRELCWAWDINRDGYRDYVCKAACDFKAYKAALRSGEDPFEVTLTGLTKKGDNFEASCAFEVEQPRHRRPRYRHTGSGG